MTAFASQSLIGAIDLGFDPTVEDIGSAIHEASLRSIERVQQISMKALSKESLIAVQANAQAEIEAAFADGTWIKRLPGRDILRAFANDLPNGISHETLRNMIVNKMIDDGYVPMEMREVITQIVSA